MGFCGDSPGCGKLEKPPLAVFETRKLLATKNRQWQVLGGSKLFIFLSKKVIDGFCQVKNAIGSF